MSEKLEPNPIQRNKNDLAFELLTMHERNLGIKSSEEICELFAKYYSVVDTITNSRSSTKDNFLPDNFKK